MYEIERNEESFGDYSITRIGQNTQIYSKHGSILFNFDYIELKYDDHVLFSFDTFKKHLFLQLAHSNAIRLNTVIIDVSS